MRTLPSPPLAGDPGKGVAVSDLPEKVGIDIAYGGCCTGGKLEDIEAYYETLKSGADHGLQLAPGVSSSFNSAARTCVSAVTAQECRSLSADERSARRAVADAAGC
ncbi:hypothetical protein [Variovorax sp. E3]|uniref:hypothetical protein n=1 Tax=Variovorax sp. E3 TaxID=1914993 RepID=UPI0018DC675D|nr:hypothetical protein [Variovorax sp. E3]